MTAIESLTTEVWTHKNHNEGCEIIGSNTVGYISPNPRFFNNRFMRLYQCTLI